MAAGSKHDTYRLMWGSDMGAVGWRSYMHGGRGWRVGQGFICGIRIYVGFK